MTPIAAMLLASSSGNLPAWCAVGAGAGVYFFYRGFRLLQRRRLILNTPASKIRSASIGLVEISGLATGPYVITSPLKQVECFYYKSIAWELRQQGKNSEWVKIGEEILHVPFYLDDGTGTLLIDPAGADMDLHCDLKEEYGGPMTFSHSEISSGVSDFLTRHGANFNHRLKVEEFCIKPKNFLFILGTLAQNPHREEDVTSLPAPNQLSQQAATATAGVSAGADVPFHPGPPFVGKNYHQIPRLPDGSPAPGPTTGMSQQQIVAAAMMKAGIVNPAAWAIAGVSPQAAAQLKLNSATANASASGAPKQNSFAPEAPLDAHPPVVLMKGTHDPCFLISWRSQRDLISSLGWKSSLMIWGGPALTLVCIYILLANFNLL
ncbi:MAG TPA: hypothetical protein VJO35_02170 [Terriglobales bacterium]|nr:hypothetical protein [Terriglobales bacterium]